MSEERAERPYPIDRCDECGTDNPIGYGRCCTRCIMKHGQKDSPLMFRLLEASRQEAWDKVDELQKRGSALENDRRMWKSRAESCRKIIDALVERAIAEHSKDEMSAKSSEDLMRSVVERIWLLEHDAWTQTTQVAKMFVREVKGINELNGRETDPDAKIMAFARLVDSTFERFKAIVGED